MKIGVSSKELGFSNAEMDMDNYYQLSRKRTILNP